jgi:hypothetical protein
MKPISVPLHAAAEPFLAIVLIVMPWILGYDDSDSATIVSIAAGIITLLVGGTTRWRLSVAKIIPLHTHKMLDIGLGVLLIVLPFILGYTDETGATVFHIVMGLLFIGSGTMTAWDHAGDFADGPNRTAGVR